MGSYDGAEICEWVGMYILDRLSKVHAKCDVGLYRDDGQAVIRNATGRMADRTRKDFTKIFKDTGLKITAETNLKVVNFLDTTLNLSIGLYQPYRKPNDQPRYVNVKSNHPPTILKNLPSAIGKRLSSISSNPTVFADAAPLYQQALVSSGYNEKIQYSGNQGTRKCQKKRNITWFNPPFSKSVSTDVARRFLRLLDRHFPKKSELHKLFNRSTMKVSYSTMPSMARIINK